MKTWLILLVAGICSAIPLDQGGAEHPVLDYPEEVPGLFEGDIDLEPGEDPTHRNSIVNRNKTWPGGVVPYVIQASYPSAVKTKIHEAMHQITELTKVHGRTCIHFKPRAHEAGYISFFLGTGCHSPVGFSQHEKKISIGHGCEAPGTTMHEILHALGMHHEQARHDRDKFVTVHLENVKDGHQGNFNKIELPNIDELGQPYDYGSIMHYGMYAFSIDRTKPTIVPKQHGVTLGNRKTLSPIDIKEIQILYGCIPDPRPVTAAPAPAGLCTFQSDLCHWKNVAGDQMDWTRHRGSIPNSNTGPVNDPHNSHPAYYVYIGDGHTHHTSRTAKLDSKAYPSGDYCLDFYYHMYGDQRVSLYLNYITPDHHVHRIKTMHGSTSHSWHHIRQHTTVHTSRNFKFEVVGQIGSGSSSVIALDDIAVHPGRC